MFFLGWIMSAHSYTNCGDLRNSYIEMKQIVSNGEATDKG